MLYQSLLLSALLGFSAGDPGPAGDFYNVVVDGTTFVALAGPEASSDALHRRQVDLCVSVGDDGIGRQCTRTYVDSTGHTIIQNEGGAVTLATGASGLITATFTDGLTSTTTITASDLVIVTSDEEGQTILSNANSAVTLPTGATTTIETVLPNGETTTIPPLSTRTQTTVSDGHTVISVGESAITLPTGATTPVVTILPNGDTTTIAPQLSSGAAAAATTVVNGQTIISIDEGAITLPTGVTTPLETILADGETTTILFPTATTSDSPSPFLFPIITTIPAPKPTDDGTAIPCDLWFFSICLRWDDFSIGGWRIDLPPGTYPPGPPPPITEDPKLGVSISVKGTLPKWPKLTIGPDRLPTYPPRPDNCETESAELCATSTSYGVSNSGTSTITTGSQVVSTCATVYGCNLRDQSTDTTSTSTCTSSACQTCLGWDLDNIGPVENDDSEGDTPDRADASPGAQRLRRMPEETASTLVRIPAGMKASQAFAPSPTAPPLDSAALVKRAKVDTRSIETIGGCRLNTVASYLDYFEPSDWTPPIFNGRGYFLITRSSTVDGTCFAGIPYSTSDFANARRAPNELQYVTKPIGQPAPLINTDHVYENALLRTFLEYIFGQPNALSCQEFNEAFVDTGFLQDLCNNLANVNHPGVVAMDKAMNSLKAHYFVSAFGVPNVRATQYDRAARELQNYGVVASMIAFPDLVTRFRQTHERLYQVFGSIDDEFSRCYKPATRVSWPASYSKWMTSFLSSRGAVWTGAASSWYSMLTQGSTDGSAVPVFTHLASTYPVQSFTLPVNDMASGLKPYTPSGIEKRQAACTLTRSPNSNSALSTDLPLLTSAIVTPSGSSCVSTVTELACSFAEGGSNCFSSPGCISWTTTGTTTSTASSAAATASSKPEYKVNIAIYKNKKCTQLLEKITLAGIGTCYEPAKKFKCFKVLDATSDAITWTVLTAFKGEGCFSADGSDREVFSDLAAIEGKDEKPFKMGSLSLDSAGD